MIIRKANELEIADWNKKIVANPDGGNIFQTLEFGKIKSTNGWNPIYLIADNIFFMVLEKQIPILGILWYVPKGPGVASADQLKPLLPPLKQFAKENKAFMVKIEPELLENDENVKKINKLGLRKQLGVQAANTVIIDTTDDIDTIQSRFSSQVRNKIRLAVKDGVVTKIVPVNDENCKLFFDMMVKTINGRSPLRDYEYFKLFWQSHDQAGTGIFMFAYANNQVICTDYIEIIGQKAYRKDAASIRDTTVRGASSLLELNAIKYLREKGVTKYDLYGSPPSDQIKNPKHPFYGFGTFKAGFNSEITDYIGCLDLIVKPFAYKIWSSGGERIYRRIYLAINHDRFY